MNCFLPWFGMPPLSSIKFQYMHLTSVPLVYLLILELISHYFNYFGIFFKLILIILGSLFFYVNFRMTLLNSIKIPNRIFTGIVLSFYGVIWGELIWLFHQVFLLMNILHSSVYLVVLWIFNTVLYYDMSGVNLFVFILIDTQTYSDSVCLFYDYFFLSLSLRGS